MTFADLTLWDVCT